MDDAALVEAAVAGDRDAFAAIYDRYASRLHDFIHSVLRNRDEAADVLHDTFVTAGARIGQLRDPSKLRPWLYAIARHRALRVAARWNRLESLDGLEVTATGPRPEEVSERGDLVELVWSAADGLSARDRVVLDLHLRQGLEGQDLGDAMGVSADHAYVMLSRLRDQVERSLGAMLVARQGRSECDELAAILEGWDGRFSTVWRKRVARHVDGCDICETLRRSIASPVALLSATPAIALPASLRQRVLDDVDLCGAKGRPWPASQGGFPPSRERRRRRPVLTVLAAIVVVLAGVVAMSGDGQERPLEPAAESLTTSTMGGTFLVGPAPTLLEDPVVTPPPTSGRSGSSVVPSTTGRPRTTGTPTAPTQPPQGQTTIAPITVPPTTTAPTTRPTRRPATTTTTASTTSTTLRPSAPGGP